MPLISLEQLDLSFGEQIIFDKLDLHLERGQKVGLIGRNGEGKSTLLKTILGEQEIDDGRIYRHPDLLISYVSQDLPPSSKMAVSDYVVSGAQSLKTLIDEFHILSTSDRVDLDELNRLQQEIEARDGWNLEHRLQKILKQFELDKGQRLDQLSGGWRRKASLARALICNPDMILLDEPTNHLDVGLIRWLEDFVKGFAGVVLLITHDRAFLRAVCNQIIELDRGKLTSWSGTYSDFLDFKKKQLQIEEKDNALFDKRLAQEEAWIREGIKARRTRNEGRVRALKKMRDERSKRRERMQLGKLEISEGNASGKLVVEMENVSFAYGEETIIREFSSIIVRGDKIGFIGPNGAGKSTLLKLILGELEESDGKIKRGTALKVAYFDQMRDQINDEENIVDNVGQGRQSISINGKDKHVLSYLQDFMFSPKRARTPIKALSGGEQSRVMLAKLFCNESNLLVLDEPTNDLDTETLELLESLLVSYEGTVLIVTHDREFLDNVVSSSYVFEGNGVVREYVGGYQDWLRQGGDWDNISGRDVADEPTGSETKTSSASQKKSTKKLSYKLQRELDELPNKIDALERTLADMNATIGEPSFYQQDASAIEETLTEHARVESDLQAAYLRWEELETLQA